MNVKLGVIKMAMVVGLLNVAAFGAGGGFVVDGVPQKDAGATVNGLTNNGMIIAAGQNITLNGGSNTVALVNGGSLTIASTGDGSGGSLTNIYGWVPADYLYNSTLETLANGNGGSVFTKHDKTRVDYAGPVSCPTPDAFTSNVVFRWYTYHTMPGTYAIGCRWRGNGLNAWSYVTSGLFTASTVLTNLSTATLATKLTVGDNALIEMEYWVVPTNAPGGGTAGGFGYVKGIKIGLEARK